MKSIRPDSIVGLPLSGGLDSTILLGTLLQRGCRVQPIYVRARLQWESAELAAVRRVLAAMASPRLAGLIVLDSPADDLYGDHWSTTGCGVPDSQSGETAVFLPGRNALLLVKVGIWCSLHGIDELAVALLATNPFGDATPEFLGDLESALRRAMGTSLKFSVPFAQMTKLQVMELGRSLPLELTFCCLAPVGQLHCGRCNKCRERMEAFRDAHIEDRTCYASGATGHGLAVPAP